MLPFKPMSPILVEHLPVGDEWRYQLKWDGIRIIAEIQGGKVTLYSKNMQIRNESFPELVSYLAQIRHNCILDGEAVVIEPTKQRPDFHSILRRLRYKKGSVIELATRSLPVTYALFDLLSYKGVDIRSEKLRDRIDRLQQLVSNPSEQCIVTDLFEDGLTLWDWVQKHEWEGVISKKVDSFYRVGKKHSDWYKTKIIRTFEVKIVAYTINEGRLASLVMTLDDLYCGKVSAGLNERMKRQLMELAISSKNHIEIVLPSDLSRNNLHWLKVPFKAIVSSLELTDYGVLRHPKIVELREMEW